MFRLILLAAGLALVAGQAAANCANVSGTWRANVRIDARKCEDGIKTERMSLAITQRGCAITVDLGGVALKGTVAGTRARVTGAYNDEGVVTKNLTLDFSGARMTGSGVWTYRTTGFKCAGTERITATR